MELVTEIVLGRRCPRVEAVPCGLRGTLSGRRLRKDQLQVLDIVEAYFGKEVDANGGLVHVVEGIIHEPGYQGSFADYGPQQ